MKTVIPAPKITRGPTLPLVWIVPLVALAVGAWMVWREFRQRGPAITIEFADGSGIEAHKTELEYKGVTVGTVTAVELSKELNHVLVHLRLNRNAAALAREGAQFWIVHPEIGFSGVRGLDTIFTGVRLNVLPGNGGPATSFVGLEHPPTIANVGEGRAFVLQAERLGSISAGAPVFYRELRVGVVEACRLAGDSTSVLIRIRVQTPYIDLVRTNTRFWNAGGASFHLSFLGAQLKTTSLESLFAGGIAFATPDGKDLGAPAPDGMQFKLYSESEKEWLRWSPQIRINPPDEEPEAKPRPLVAPLSQPATPRAQ